MKLILTSVLLLVSVTGVNANDVRPTFKVIEVQQIGAFDRVSYRILANGKFRCISRQGKLEGQLPVKELRALSRIVAAVNWRTMPSKLHCLGPVCDLEYRMRFVIGKTTHHVTAKRTAARRHVILKRILIHLAAIRRQQLKK